MTVGAEALEAARRNVAGGCAPSVSAWVNEAMEAKAKREQARHIVAEIRAEIGPETPEGEAWARSVLGLRSSTPVP